MGKREWTPTGGSTLPEWCHDKIGTGCNKKDTRAIIILVMWALWKHRNSIVFDGQHSRETMLPASDLYPDRASPGGGAPHATGLAASISPTHTPPPAMFGVVFPDHTFPLDATAFAQVAPASWLLDLSTLSLPSAPRSAVVFLLPPAAAALPPGKAVAVYYQAVAGERDAAALPSPPDEQRAERVALRVGENLFNFMQSFCAADGGKLVVPTDILDRWFRKFQERAKKDPTYLKSFDF
uniref:Hikeshi-like C-terminal domain-containing protein n=1 Tax=Aegilops tauschii TaxID=37682 RepID=R7W7W8_AEGTA